ncbi:tRNA pseudouridine(55) synthase TruB [Candidatus Saccharibacteria bacterium]|nr:tRNA pseudouridine(55) synthase TruB [Candidatus Saccharibacteria bacterium]
MEGILLIDKPEGWTSFDVVSYVRKMVACIEGKKPRNVKVGHTGTLDPAATGLLMLAVGKKYTSQMPDFMKKDKTYQTELTLGKTSTTGDREGEITNVSETEPTLEDVQAALEQFVGEISQVPPMYSAVKVDGKRAYELARSGKEVELKPRKVTIYSINDIIYAYPTVTFTTRVSSGTYIRSLAADIGEKLGCGAYMSNLQRTAIGDAEISKAHAISDLNEELLQKSLASNR